MPHTPPRRTLPWLRLLLVALLVSAGAGVGGPGRAAGSGPVDSRAHPSSGSATLPLRGPRTPSGGPEPAGARCSPGRLRRHRVGRGRCGPGHRSTAFDLAILARAVLQDACLAKVVRKGHAAFIAPGGRRHELTSRSRFLLGYRGAVGVKTGFTDDAGHCLAAAATRGGRTLIAVVLHSPDNAADAGRMLDWGFSPGRSARTGVRLPGYVRPAGVAALLTRPPTAVERHRRTVVGAMAAAGLARVVATPAPRPAGSPARWSGADRQRGHRGRSRARPAGRDRAGCPQTSPMGLTPALQ